MNQEETQDIDEMKKDTNNKEQEDVVDNTTLNQQPGDDKKQETKNDKSSSNDDHNSGTHPGNEEEEDDDDDDEKEQQPEPEKFNDAPPEHMTLTCSEGRSTDIHIYNAKAKETVVIFHGFGGRKEEFQEGHMAQRLATKYRVITFDWYGHGKSSKSSVYNKEAFLEQADTVVSNLMKEDDQFHLYCFSMGNFLGLQYVKRNPHRIQRMVLQSPWNAECSSMAPFHTIEYTMRIPLIGLMVCDLFRRTALRHVHDARTYKQIMLTLGEGTKKWKELLDELASSSSEAALNDVLIICGELEIPFHLIAKDIHKRFQPKSKMVTWKTAGHMTWNEKWNKPVGAFFRNHVYEFLTSSSNTTNSTTTTAEGSS